MGVVEAVAEPVGRFPALLSAKKFTSLWAVCQGLKMVFCFPATVNAPATVHTTISPSPSPHNAYEQPPRDTITILKHHEPLLMVRQ